MTASTTLSAASANAVPADLIQPFQVERYALRGRLVRLGAVADDVLGRHGYPEPVARMLGEMMAVAATLAGALKYDGVFTLQAQGNGPIGLMVADVTSAGDMRAYAQFDADRLAKAETAAHGPIGDSVPQLLGVGHLAFTVDQGPDTERYQGIVDLAGSTLADCVHHYFRQSEQIEAALKLAVEHVGDSPDSGWRIGALMMQRLPKVGGVDEKGMPAPAIEMAEDEREEGWREALILMGSATNAELTSGALTAEGLLYRLFHEPGVRVYKTMPLQSACRCSQARVETMLRSFPKAEIEEMKVDGKIVVTCEFCRRSYSFDQALLDGLYAEQGEG